MSASSISFKSFALPTHPSLYDTALYHGYMKMEPVKACAAERFKFDRILHANFDRTSDRPDLDPKCGNLHLVPSIANLRHNLKFAVDNSYYAG